METGMIKKKKVLFLWLNDKEFHPMNAKSRGVAVDSIYKDLPNAIKIFRRLQIRYNIPGIRFLLGSWKHSLKNFDVVIIHASILTPPVVNYINKKHSNIRIIVWYWNPVDKSVDLKGFEKYDCEIWSFDELDCKKYELNYNTQYYFNDVPLPKAATNQDVFFVGGDKGRIPQLIELKEELNSHGISNYFHITPTGKENLKFTEHYRSRLSYEEVLKYISSCKVIVDYVSEKQTGLTLRPLESLFYQKKLITNDKTIVNRDFYVKENIFIYGKDDLCKLVDFVKTPYKEIDREVSIKYDFNTWLSNFFSAKEKNEIQ